MPSTVVRRAQDTAPKFGVYQNDVSAQYNLGMRCLEGKGIPPNLVEAWKWLALAEAGGITDAHDAKRTAASRLTSEQLRQAREEFAHFQKKVSSSRD